MHGRNFCPSLPAVPFDERHPEPALPTAPTELAAELAHRLNSPLQVMFASIDRLAREPALPEDALADLTSAAVRIRAVVAFMVSQFARGAMPNPTPASSAGPPVKSGVPNTDVRILIVDDDPTILRALARHLRAYDVVALADATTALQRIGNGERFDFVLSDIIMPRMSGIVFQRAVATIDPAQAERIVFMTGGATSPEEQRFLRDTTNVVLSKPFDIGELQNLVRTYRR